MDRKLPDIIKSESKRYQKEFRRIIKAITKYDKIAIFRHTTPDYDALGSQLGFASWIKDNFPNKEVVCLGDNHYNYTPRVFKEMDRVNANWFDDPVLAIMVDVANTPRIADPRYKKAKYKIRIDHHPQVEKWGKIILIDETFVACAEILGLMFLSFKDKYVLSEETAKNLYIGIVGDSGGFKYQHTEPRTFHIAGELVNVGLNVPEITQNMFLKPKNDLDLKKYILNNYTLTEQGVAYYILTDEIQKELGIATEQGKESINIFANIEGINAWVSATEDVEDHNWRWRISLRSKTTPINEVASHFNGGGHENASGAKLKKIEELPALIEELNNLFK